MEAIWERSREVGRLVAQTDEYGALKRANTRLADDREAVQMLNELAEVQDRLTSLLRSGQEPTVEEQEAFDALAARLQGSTAYQAVIAAQSNFDRLMMRINEEIARGVEAGEQSRIILAP
jgi:cell fate (sporulation/competence/biofilm development) regulator YlbF (YheA/YmcA/DUF963 family)